MTNDELKMRTMSMSTFSSQVILLVTSLIINQQLEQSNSKLYLYFGITLYPMVASSIYLASQIPARCCSNDDLEAALPGDTEDVPGWMAARDENARSAVQVAQYTPNLMVFSITALFVGIITHQIADFALASISGIALKALADCWRDYNTHKIITAANNDRGASKWHGNSDELKGFMADACNEFRNCKLFGRVLLAPLTVPYEAASRCCR